MKTSIIIPTLNGGVGFDKLLRALQRQIINDYQLIVVDSGSKDQTINLANSFANLVIKVPLEEFDHGATRNLAAAAANTDLIIFMTQDALPYDRQTIGNLIEPLLQNDLIAVSYARQIAASDASPSEKYLRLTNYPPQSQVKSKDTIAALGIKAFQSSNVCAAYNRGIFEELGCFPAPVACNEDMLFAACAIMAGYSVAYTAEAKVWHTHNLGSRAQFRRYFDIAASLDYDPRIKTLGKAEEKGLQFVKSQIAYLRSDRKLTYMPLTILGTAAKYFGYLAGSRHRYIPDSLKAYLGSNKVYWKKAAVKKKKI